MRCGRDWRRVHDVCGAVHMLAIMFAPFRFCVRWSVGGQTSVLFMLPQHFFARDCRGVPPPSVYLRVRVWVRVRVPLVHGLRCKDGPKTLANYIYSHTWPLSLSAYGPSFACGEQTPQTCRSCAAATGDGGPPAGFVRNMCVCVWYMVFGVPHTHTQTGATKHTHARAHEHLNKFGLHFRNLTVLVQQERAPRVVVFSTSSCVVLVFNLFISFNLIRLVLDSVC